MTEKNCNDRGACAHVDGKVTAYGSAIKTLVDNECGAKETLDYGFYSNVLKKPFERLDDLKKAEEVYYAEQKAKEAKVNQKKTDAKKVEDAFRALNVARKTYKEDLAQLTKEYSEALEKSKKAFDFGRKDIQKSLATAEDNYAAALKEFNEKYKEGYHLTLKDGDFETTISSSVKTDANTKVPITTNSENFFDVFDWFFGVR